MKGKEREHEGDKKKAQNLFDRPRTCLSHGRQCEDHGDQCADGQEQPAPIQPLGQAPEASAEPEHKTIEIKTVH